MRRVAVTFAVMAVVAAAGACGWDKPIPLTPSKDYPCGVTGVVCGGGMCCEQNEVCGSSAMGVGCPPGLCCYVGVDLDGPPEGMGGQRRGSHAQEPAR